MIKGASGWGMVPVTREKIKSFPALAELFCPLLHPVRRTFTLLESHIRGNFQAIPYLADKNIYYSTSYENLSGRNKELYSVTAILYINIVLFCVILCLFDYFDSLIKQDLTSINFFK